MLNKKKFIPCIRSLFTDNIPQNGNMDLSNADPSLIFYAPFKSNVGYWTKDSGWDDASYVRTSSQTYISPVNRILRTAPANVPAVGRYGVELEGAATNKCTCAKSNPQDLTNISKGGDAAAVLSVVDDAEELAAAGLNAFGPNVYKLDNSAGTAAAFALTGGTVGNTNPHSISVFARGPGKRNWTIVPKLRTLQQRFTLGQKPKTSCRQMRLAI